MLMRTALFIAAMALGLATTASAQAPEPAAPAAAMSTAPASPAPTPSPFTDQQMRAFAHATLDLQALSSADPAAMTHVIEAAGMSVEQYNTMGDAMRANPGLGASLQPYLQSAQAERDTGVYRGGSGIYAPPSAYNYRPATYRSSARHHVSSRHRVHGKAVKGRRHATSSRHAKAHGKHPAKGSAAHKPHRGGRTTHRAASHATRHSRHRR